MKNKFSLIIMLSALTASTPIFASTYTPLSLPTLNTDIRTYTSAGSEFAPLFTQPVTPNTLGGTPFDLQLSASGNNAFIGPGSLVIPVNVYGVDNVDTLINSIYGTTGTTTGSITFNGSVSSYTVDLIEGDNVRDHFYGNYVNTTSSPDVTQAVFGINSPGNEHLDMQNFILPSVFNTQMLDSITFDSYGYGNPLGTPFIVGATAVSNVAATPLPASGLLMLSALALTGIIGLRRR